MPEPRTGERGYVTLLRAIVGQQVSVKAAAAIWAKVEAATGGAADPANMGKPARRICAPPASPARKSPMPRVSPRRSSPAGLDFDKLPADDEEAIAHLTAVKGIGRWTAEIYLLFAEGRPDIFPAGDLAVQIEIGNIMGPRRQAHRKGDPRARRSLAPAPRRRGGVCVAPSAGGGAGGLTPQGQRSHGRKPAHSFREESDVLVPG